MKCTTCTRIINTCSSIKYTTPDRVLFTPAILCVHTGVREHVKVTYLLVVGRTRQTDSHDPMAADPGGVCTTLERSLEVKYEKQKKKTTQRQRPSIASRVCFFHARPSHARSPSVTRPARTERIGSFREQLCRTELIFPNGKTSKFGICRTISSGTKIVCRT